MLSETTMTPIILLTGNVHYATLISTDFELEVLPKLRSYSKNSLISETQNYAVKKWVYWQPVKLGFPHKCITSSL